MKIKEIFGNKSGSGSVYMAFVMVMISFAAVVSCINLFEIYGTSTYTQMGADIIADGAAVAGQTPLGFDEVRMNKAAEKLIEYNELLGANQTFSIDVETERAALGGTAGSRLITTQINTADSYYMPGYLYNGSYNVSSKAVVRAEEVIEITDAATSSLYHNPSGSLPFDPSYPDTRNGSYTNWFMINYLNPEFNKLYEADGNNTKTHMFIYDYLRCMGFDGFTPRTKSQLAMYFGGPAMSEGWTTISGASNIQNAANSGKPVLIVTTDSSGDTDIYVVVPESAPLESGQIATAHAGISNWNYKRSSLSSLIDGRSAHVITHD